MFLLYSVNQTTKAKTQMESLVIFVAFFLFVRYDSE